MLFGPFLALAPDFIYMTIQRLTCPSAIDRYLLYPRSTHDVQTLTESAVPSSLDMNRDSARRPTSPLSLRPSKDREGKSCAR